MASLPVRTESEIRTEIALRQILKACEGLTVWEMQCILQEARTTIEYKVKVPDRSFTFDGSEESKR